MFLPFSFLLTLSCWDWEDLILIAFSHVVVGSGVTDDVDWISREKLRILFPLESPTNDGTIDCALFHVAILLALLLRQGRMRIWSAGFFALPAKNLMPSRRWGPSNTVYHSGVWPSDQFSNTPPLTWHNNQQYTLSSLRFNNKMKNENDFNTSVVIFWVH